MTIAIINRYIQIFSEAFASLGVTVAMPEIERLAMIVHSAMENKRRVYHTSSHVFDMCHGMNPRQTLAALFHDVVYYQLDGGFPAQAATLLAPVASDDHGALTLLPVADDDVPLKLCLDLFGFQPGQVLPLFGGMNEFLSAVVAARLLQPYVAPADLIAVVACIEATVPFRGAAPDGRDCSAILADRVRTASVTLLPELSTEALDWHVGAVMQDAIRIANRDVGGFAEPNPARFLAATWLLIEESNAPLAAVGVYTLQDYRGALSRMEKFLGSLKAENIFHHYGQQRGAATYAKLTDAARQNLAFACEFLGAKLCSIAVIEALALETGGNGPVSMFLGDIRSPHGKPDRVEDFLPVAHDSSQTKPELLQVLEHGRAKESSSDLTASPLTAYMYRCMGHEGMMRAIARAKLMFDGALSPLEFLRALDRPMTLAIIDACSCIATSRNAPLQRLKTLL